MSELKRPRSEAFRVEKDEAVKFCALALRLKDGRIEGLGIHPFGRVPVIAEFVTLKPQGVRYRVERVIHCAFESSHCHAELNVVETSN